MLCEKTMSGRVESRPLCEIGCPLLSRSKWSPAASSRATNTECSPPLAVLSSHAIHGVVAFPATIVPAVTDGFSAPVPASRPVADATSSEQACSLAVLCPHSPIPLPPLVLRMSLAAVLPAVPSPTVCQ